MNRPALIPLAGWLRCPLCGRDLDEDSTAFICSSGHRFELNRRGYLGLLAPDATTRRESTREVEERTARWSTSDSTATVEAAVAMMPPGRPRVLDVGSDLGTTLAAIAHARDDLSALSVGDSPNSLVRAMATARAPAVLCDLIRELPIRDGSAEVLLAIGAPHRPTEWHRVLARGGIVIASASGSAAEALLDDVYPWFEHDQTREVGDSSALRLRRRRRPISW